MTDIVKQAEEALVGVVAFPIETAPKDGTMMRLLVNYAGPFGDHPLEDAETAWTIGFNSLEDTGEDAWQFAGWSWSQDCFTDGHGEVIGWLPFHDARAQEALIEELVGAAQGLVDYLDSDEEEEEEDFDSSSIRATLAKLKGPTNAG